MARKRQEQHDQEAVGQEGQDPENFAVRQGNENRAVGYGNPPKEHQFKPGESGNPDGPPRHRTNLWLWFTHYMAMTAGERAKMDRTKLTAAQETALKMVEKAVLGRGCGFARLARYCIDREEGKSAEHLILGGGSDLSHEECERLREQLRRQIRGNNQADGRGAD